MKVKLIFSMVVITSFVLTFNMCKEDNRQLGCGEEVGLEENYINITAKDSLYSFKVKNGIWWITSLKTIVGQDTLYPQLEVDSMRNPIKGDWYSIKRSSHQLIIHVDENQYEYPRQLFVGLQSGNWYDGIWVEQSMKKDR